MRLETRYLPSFLLFTQSLLAGIASVMPDTRIGMLRALIVFRRAIAIAIVRDVILGGRHPDTR